MSALRIYILFSLFGVIHEVLGQGHLSGNLETRAQFFVRDSVIGAINTPQYDRQLFSAEAWLSLLYRYNGFTIGVRFDMFQHTNVFNPQGSFTDQGIGRWFLEKKVDKLGITAGYIYDQIGTGIIFRSYEERALGIDNALTGIRLTYDVSDQWLLKGFVGRQKNRFNLYRPVVRALSLDGFVDLKKATASPGLGISSRTYDDGAMNGVVSTINTYSAEDQFIPKFSTYSFTLYNTLQIGNINWYVEGAYKTRDVLNDPFGRIIDRNGNLQDGNVLIQRPGNVLYTSLAYSKKGFSIQTEYKRTEFFSYRINPQTTLNEGLLNFLPPMTRLNTYRLTTLYTAATQELGEQAFQGQIRWKFSANWKSNLHFSHLEDLQGKRLYQEWVWENLITREQDFRLTWGIMYQVYNQAIYEQKPGVPLIESIIPYMEYLRQWSDTRSVRFELQYLNTAQDRGSWVQALVELGWAPKWLVTFSDMYNLGQAEGTGAHYYAANVAYLLRGNRFSFGYIRQVEGIVCAGGICRFEPAFNGVRLQVISNF